MSLEGDIQKKRSMALTRYEAQSDRAGCVAVPRRGATRRGRVGKIIDLGLTAPVTKKSGAAFWLKVPWMMANDSCALAYYRVPTRLPLLTEVPHSATDHQQDPPYLMTLPKLDQTSRRRLHRYLNTSIWAQVIV